jgi:hypothetical protein
MSKMKNAMYYEVALHTGGSHYPDVGGELLEKFADTIVEKCLTICEEHPTWTGRMIAEQIKLEFNQ